MQTRLHLSSNPSAVKVAERKRDSESTPPAPTVDVALPAGAEPASLRIRQAHTVIANLLLEDDLEHENGLLLGSVTVDLNEILLELDRISGLQRMFEAVMLDAP
jgi:hypothetical protein